MPPVPARGASATSAQLSSISGQTVHPHFHPLLFLTGSQSYAEDYAGKTTAAWVQGVELAGGHAVDAGAQLLRVLAPDVAFSVLGEYMQKQTYAETASALALETVWSQGKTGDTTQRRRNTRQRGTRAHWALLHELGTLDPSSREYHATAERWVEAEHSMTGHRQLVWSRGLRDLAGIGHELTDEEIAAAEHGTKDDNVCRITVDGWHAVRDRPELAAGLLNALEVGGWPALRDLLDAYRVEYVNEG